VIDATLLPLLLTQSGTSSTFTPLITAGGALIGVIIGGLLNWRVQQAAERRSQQVQARAGIRLLALDLLESTNNLERAGTGYWPQGTSLPTDSWRTYREHLAITLEARDWRAISEAITALDHLKVSLEKLGVGVGPQGVELPDKMQVEIAEVQGRIKSALNSCERLQRT
jgi:hypothetical protein